MDRIDILSLLAVALLAIGCAQRRVPDKAAVFYTEAGVGESYTEINTVKGRAFGYCLSNKGVFNAAIRNALKKAKRKGGDAILLPNSFNISGRKVPKDFHGCRFLPLLFLFPNGWGAIHAVAIEFNEGAAARQEVQELIRRGRIVRVRRLKETSPTH